MEIIIILIFVLLIINNNLISEEQSKRKIFNKVNNAFELRGDAGLNYFELEYRRYWIPILSSDIFLRLNDGGGINVGASVYPPSFYFFELLFLQGFIGSPYYKETIVDGPVFNPEYVYGLKYGIKLPFLKDRFIFSVSVGKNWIVDKNYCYNCGFPPPGITFIPKHKVEYRQSDLFDIGFGIRF